MVIVACTVDNITTYLLWYIMPLGIGDILYHIHMANIHGMQYGHVEHKARQDN